MQLQTETCRYMYKCYSNMIYACTLMVINLSLLVKYAEEINHFTVKLKVLPVQWLLYKNVQNFTHTYILNRLITTPSFFYRILGYFLCEKN